MQLVAPPDGEGVLLSLAAQLERARDWPAHRPAAARMSRRAAAQLAEEVAREAGAQLLEAYAGPAREVEAKSTPTDLVSAADQAAEDADPLAHRRVTP